MQGELMRVHHVTYRLNLMGLLIIFPLIVQTYGHGIQFWKERIDIAILAEDTFRVAGQYVFKNKKNANSTFNIFYPFPVDSTIDFPTTTGVYFHNAGTNLAFRKIRNANYNGITFRVPFKSLEICTVTVTYKQHVNKPEGIYILTTTQHWKKPLAHAAFFIKLPGHFQLRECTYPIATTTHGDNSTTHFFERTDFMPEKDLGFCWDPGFGVPWKTKF